jgi:predicted nucleic acid-binding protein
MPAKVVDASAVAAILFVEPEGQGVADRLAGAKLVAPTLLSYELANVCAIKGRRSPDQRRVYEARFALLGGLGVEEVAVDHGGVVRLAASTGLTAYDANYLWLARRLGVELITLDRRLATASAGALP